MFNFKDKKKTNIDIEKVAKRQLKKNVRVIQSLGAYDQGKKDISITKLERRLTPIRVTS